MALIDDLARQVGELDSQIRELSARQDSSVATLARAIRKTRLGLTAVENEQALRRLRPPTSLLNWQPREGEPADPDLETSLIARLRKGNPVADSLGNVDPYAGVPNLLINPTLHGFGPGTLNATGAETRVSDGWGTGHAVTAGSVYQNFIDDVYNRGDVNDNPFASAILEWDLGVDPSSVADFVLRSHYISVANGMNPGSFDPPPYLVGAFRLIRYSSFGEENLVNAYVQVRIIDKFDGSVIAESEQLDYYGLTLLENRRLYCATAAGAAVSIMGHSYKLELRVHLETSAAGTAGPAVFLGEPQLAYSYSPDPPPYAPAIAHWMPDRVRNFSGYDTVESRQLTDTFTRLRVTSDGELRMGSGAAVADTVLRRIAAQTFRVSGESVGAGDQTGGLEVASLLAIRRNLTDSADRRNWGFATEQLVTGDLAVVESASNIGSPFSGGSSRWRWTRGGGIATGGTVFPPNPVEGDQFYRTDYFEWFSYSAALNKWLALAPQQIPLVNRDAHLPFVGPNLHLLRGMFGRLWSYSGIYVDSIGYSIYPVAPHGPAAYWDLQFRNQSGTILHSTTTWVIAPWTGTWGYAQFNIGSLQIVPLFETLVLYFGGGGAAGDLYILGEALCRPYLNP